jgi:hypothetical protein
MYWTNTMYVNNTITRWLLKKIGEVGIKTLLLLKI